MSSATPVSEGLGALALEALAGLDPEAGLFALLDGARNDRIVPELRASGRPMACLFGGKRLAPELAAAAPWLVDLGGAHESLTQWLATEGCGDNWGVFLSSPSSLEDLRAHFAKLLTVKLEGAGRVYFRFFDPRVLSVYLPTCTPAELQQVFGSATDFVLESRGRPPELLRFSLNEEHELVTTRPEPAPPSTEAPATEAPAIEPSKAAEAIASIVALRERARQREDELAQELADELQILRGAIGSLDPHAEGVADLHTELERLVKRLDSRDELTLSAVRAGLNSLLLRLKGY